VNDRRELPSCLRPFPTEIDPLDLYASAIDTSDYVAAVAPVVRRLLPETGRLLDVGAGGGQIGGAIRDPGRDPGAHWTAIEPSAAMRARLQRYAPPPRIVASGWEKATIAPRAHDTVLAATMPACFDQPEAFLARCRAWARRAVVWIVPAQAGRAACALPAACPRRGTAKTRRPASRSSCAAWRPARGHTRWRSRPGPSRASWPISRDSRPTSPTGWAGRAAT
jgi:hypothetical protein